MVECSHFWAPSFMIQNEDPLLILEIHIVQELCDFSLGMLELVQCLHVRIIQHIILGYFKAKSLVIKLGKIKVTLWFVHKFMYEWLNLSF